MLESYKRSVEQSENLEREREEMGEALPKVALWLLVERGLVSFLG